MQKVLRIVRDLAMAKIGRMNGCLIEGTVENCVIGRGCTIKEGAVLKNCVVGADVVIGKGRSR